MTEQHLITPPDELVEQWASESLATQHLCTQGARWGADQELEACDEWVVKYGLGLSGLTRFRAAMRPSIKERIAAAITAGDERTALSLLNEALPNG